MVAPATKVKAGRVKQKKKTTKTKTKASKTAGAAPPAKKKKGEVIIADADPTQRLPDKLKAYSMYKGKYHEITVLSAQQIRDEMSILNQLTVPVPNCELYDEQLKASLVASGLPENQINDSGKTFISAVDAIKKRNLDALAALEIDGWKNDNTNDFSMHEWEYYIHYNEWDRRMDQWVTRAEIVLEIPQAAKDRGEGKPPKDSHEDHGNFTEEDLKAHEEATKVKNVDKIVLGKFIMDTWYYSPLPHECNKFGILYFCEFCLSFFGFKEDLNGHQMKCQMRHPPGNEIYRSSETNVDVCVFEVDGAKEQQYAENLCYISKLYLDHKTLEYDCTPFLFYIVCEFDDRGCHIVGYFSKEKISYAKYNLACILCLPSHQRKGYGKFIISLSYELSKIEEKPGSPEKPISDLGKVSYMSYWSETLVKLMYNMPLGSECSVDDIVRITCMTAADIIETLKHNRILVWYKGKWTFSRTKLIEVKKRLDESKKKEQERRAKDPTMMKVSFCNPEKLIWTPFFASKKSRHNDINNPHGDISVF